MSLRSWRRAGAVFGFPVALASGCLLVAPPEDVPAPGASGKSTPVAAGGAGSPANASGGFGAANVVAGDGGEAGSEGGTPVRAGSGGSRELGASGGRAAVRGGTGGGGTSGDSTGGSVEPAGGAGEGGAPGCTTNQACSDDAHEPSRCRPSDHTCVALKSNECPLVTGSYEDPNALYLGAFAVLNPDNPADSDVYLAEKLAVDEINAAGGLPGGPGGASRPLVLVTCTNDGVDVPNAVSLSMTHLAEEVQVPGLIAMLQPADLTSAFQQEVDRELFFLNPVATLHRLAVDTKTTMGLLWTLLGQPSDYAPAYSLLLSELETHVRAERGLMPSDAIKVALVTTSDDFDADLRFYVFQSLVFNGESAANEQDIGNYAEFDATTAATQSVADDILAFAPDIVLSMAADPMTETGGVLSLVESGWSSTKAPPYYVLSPYNATTDAQYTVVSVISNELTDDPQAARRFLGVNAAAAADQTLENAYETRYDSAYPGAASSAAANTDNYYDAVYYLAYALYAADPKLGLTGPGIAAGMNRLVSGDAEDDGPTDIPHVVAALDSESSISLDSTLGPPDFDTTTGVRPVTPGVYCFATNGITRYFPNALRYDSSSNSFTGSPPDGSYPCMDNFPPQ